MVTKKKKKKLKKRKPKGKPLSEAIEEKQAARADEDEDELRSEPPPHLEEEGEDDEGESEPPPEDEEEDEAEREERELQEEIEREREKERAARAAEEGAEEEEEAPASETDEEEGDEEELAAAHMGHQRYVIGAFFVAWMVGGYIIGKTLETIWSRLAAKDWFVESATWLVAIPHEGELVSRSSISLGIGALIAGAVVLRYYYRPDVREWTDEVAEEIGHVKWPTRKEIGNNTVVVLVTATLLTAYLTVLDRLWSFVTNLIYTGGTGAS